MKKLIINKKNAEKTLGSLIREAREKSTITISEISFRTKIHKTLLLHLENDRYEKLPNTIYITGFLKSLSNVLEFDLKEAQDLLAIKSEKQNVSVRTWRKVKVLSLKLPFIYKKTARLSGKVMLTCISGLVACGFFAFMMIGYGLRRGELIVRNEVAVKKHSPIIKELPAFTNPISITIEALYGDSWIAYKVNNDKVVTFTLKKGKNLNLKASAIRLVLGNYSALKITKDGEEFVYNGKLVKNVANVIFPEKLKEQYEMPYISFSKDGSTAPNEHFKTAIEI